MANVDKLKAYKGEVPTCWKRAIAFQPAVVMPAACDERNGPVGQIYGAAGLSDTAFVPAATGPVTEDGNRFGLCPAFSPSTVSIGSREPDIASAAGEIHVTPARSAAPAEETAHSAGRPRRCVRLPVRYRNCCVHVAGRCETQSLMERRRGSDRREKRKRKEPSSESSSSPEKRRKRKSKCPCDICPAKYRSAGSRYRHYILKHGMRFVTDGPPVPLTADELSRLQVLYRKSNQHPRGRPSRSRHSEDARSTSRRRHRDRPSSPTSRPNVTSTASAAAGSQHNLNRRAAEFRYPSVTEEGQRVSLPLTSDGDVRSFRIATVRAEAAVRPSSAGWEPFVANMSTLRLATANAGDRFDRENASLQFQAEPIPELLSSPGLDDDDFALFPEIDNASASANGGATDGPVAAFGPTSASGDGAASESAILPPSTVADVPARYPVSDGEHDPMVMETSESKLLSPVNLDTLVTMMLQRPGVALSDIQAAIRQHAERDNLSVDMPLTGLLLQSLHRYEIAIAPELRRLVCGAIVDDPTGQLAYLSVMEYLHRLGDRPDQLAIPRGSNSSPRAVVSDAEGHSDESCHSNFVVLRRE